jgi:hypothetical protein
MLEKRWLLRLGPPVAALGALGLLASASTGAVGRPWEPPPCAARAGAISAAAAVEAPVDPEHATGEVWYRLDPHLADDGALAGQRLEIGWRGARHHFLELPPESFAAGPFGRLILVGSDDGQASELAAIDLSAGCAWSLGGDASVIRRATIAPDAASIYDFRVDRTTRADLGVWRRSLDGSVVRRVIDPLPQDGDFGPTFTTELSWTAERDRLVVQSCGAAACRTRLFDPLTARVSMTAGRDQGELIGVAGGLVVHYAATCGGLPCPILAVDVATGSSRVLADAAGFARLVTTSRGSLLVTEVQHGDRRALRIVALDGTDEHTVEVADRLRLVPDAARSASGIRTPAGWALLAPNARVGLSPRNEMLIRLDDGAIVRRLEVSQ